MPTDFYIHADLEPGGVLVESTTEKKKMSLTLKHFLALLFD